MSAILTIINPAIASILMLFKPKRNFCLIVLLVIACLNLIFSFNLAFMGLDKTRRFAGGLLLVDSISILFLCLISIIFLGVSLYILSRVLSSEAASKNIEKFVLLSLGFLSCLCASVLSNHLILTWVLLEASTLFATPLIYFHRRNTAFQAAWRYLLFSSVGLILAFFGFACLQKGFSNYSDQSFTQFFIDDMQTAIQKQSSNISGISLWERAGLVLIIFGLGTKLGLAPLYAWLPETYDEAPPSVTALLSAVQFNCVIVAIFRILQIFRSTHSDLILYELVAMGLISMLVSTMYIITTHNYKKLISYAAINHIGVISIGLGIGKSAMYGTMLYIFSNALVKAMLFLTAGNIKSHYRTKNPKEAKGLLREMPYSGFFFMVGIWALLGFAPFGSFLGEVIIMNGLIQGRHFIIFAAFCILMTISFIAMGRTVFPMIWGEGRENMPIAKESMYTILPNIFFFSLLILLGVYLPAPISDSLKLIAKMLGGN